MTVLARPGMIPIVAGAVAIAIGAMALVGWVFDVALLTQLRPGLAATRPNTALCLVLAGASLGLANASAPASLRRAAQLAALLVLAIAMATLAEHLLGRDLGIDQLVLRVPGRMGVNTTVAMLLLAAGLLALHTERPRLRAVGELSAVGALGIVLVTLIGYAYSATALTHFGSATQMAVQTAVGLFALSIGVLTARPDSLVLMRLGARGASAVLVRRFLPITAGALFLTGFIRLRLSDTWFAAVELGVAAMVVTGIAFLAGGTLWSAGVIEREEQERIRTQRLLREREEQTRHGLEQQVTERTAALRASEEQFRSLASSALDAIITADVRGQITYFNPGAERMFGYAAAEVLGQPLTVLMPERFQDPHRQGLARYLATREARIVGSTVELAGRRKDGAEFPLELSLASWIQGGEPAFAAIMRDITRRKHTEEALRQYATQLQDALRQVKDNESRLEQIFESLPVAIYVVDHDGRPRYANRLSQEILGRGIAPDAKAEDLARVHRAYRAGTDQIYPGDEQPIVHALNGRPAHAADFEIRRPDGPRRIEVWAAPVYDSDGRLTFAVAAFTDITERERARAEIERLNEELARRINELETVNRELDTFCYSVSHDLRAPLRSIDGFSRMLLEDYGPVLDAEAQRLLGVVRDSTRGMGQLIDDLLAFSRLSRQAIEPGPVNMRELARAAAGDVRSAGRKGATVEIGDMPQVRGDAALLRQVWVNLIGNALKFSRKEPRPLVKVGAANGAGETVFFVSDNGVGFDMAYADKLFGVFQRLHESEEFEGTGVGLAIVQRVIHRHGGRVWAEAAPGQGATFYFTLPADAALT